MTTKERPIIFSGDMVRAILDGRNGVRSKLYVGKGQDTQSPEHLANRLANGIDSAPDGKCWTWERTRNNFGYGTLTVEGRRVLAHRLAFELSGRTIPDGHHVLHSCDNPSCINPEHLSTGSRSQNMRECHDRGRSRIPSPSKPGEKNPSAKLSEEQVRRIRRYLSAGAVQAVIARAFGVSQSTISDINLGKKWSHVK